MRGCYFGVSCTIGMGEKVPVTQQLLNIQNIPPPCIITIIIESNMQTKYLEGPPMFESAEHCLPSSCKQMSSMCTCNSCVWTSGITYSNLTFVDNHFGKVLQGRLILSFNSVIMTSEKLTYQSLNYSNLTKLHSPCVSIFQGLRADTVRLLSPEDPAKISAHNAIESISGKTSCGKLHNGIHPHPLKVCNPLERVKDKKKMNRENTYTTLC